MDWNSYTSNDLYDDIVNEFSSRFCVLDIQTAVKRIDSVLPCDNRQVLFLFISPDARSYMHYLEEWGYQNMLAILLQACSLSNRLRELCAPFVSSDNFDRLMKYFKSVQDKGFQYKWCEDGLAMDVPEPFTDIVMYPMSQLHSEIVNALKMFGEFV